MLEINQDRLDAAAMKRTLVLHGGKDCTSAKSAKGTIPEDTFHALGTARVDDFAAVRVGTKLDGYEVKENLAEGGMGAVFRVADRDGKRELALKAPLPDGRGGTFAHRMRRFLREVRLTQRMNHPGVAKVVEVGQEDGLPYFTMELIEGIPLSDMMFSGVMEIADACEYIESAARAVHHIHEKGVIHRDLKPQNMLVRKDREVVIIDFGLARDAAGIDPRITQDGVWLGTPAYIAPEQAQGEASVVDARADVYSLAAVLYESLTGNAPYGSGNTKQIFKNLKHKQAENVRFARPECPEAIDKVVMKAIAKHRSDRYATALEFADALREARKSLEGIPTLSACTTTERPVADLDALESVPVDQTTPILRVKSGTSKSAPSTPSRRFEKLRPDSSERKLDQAATLVDTLAPRATGWTNLGTSNANHLAATLPLDPPVEVTLDFSLIEKPKAKSDHKSDHKTDRKLKPVAEKSSLSRRAKKRASAEAAHRKNLLVLAGPALLFICGLLLLFH